MSTHLPLAAPALPHPDPARTARLRQALLAASFTLDGLKELLGGPAYAALARNETVPALRATRGQGPLETLVRLFLLQAPAPRAGARAALPLEEALADGWLVPYGDEVRATVDIRPYEGPGGQDWWVVSDLGCAVGGAGGIRSAAFRKDRDAADRTRVDRGGADRTDGLGAGAYEAEGAERAERGESDRARLVLGVGGASATLAGITVRRPVRSALDLGTGSGIQALHAAQHATRVTATDVNPRALGFTRLTFALSGAPAADLREGSLFEPVAGETYDLIVSNPPFVISPGTGSPGARLIYRDGGMGGDELCRALVQQAPVHLTEGGYCQLLANWQHTRGQDWRERLASWVPPGCDAWIVQREVQDVAQYAELWLRDAGEHLGDPAAYAARYDAWLDEFEARDTTAVGFGWIVLRKSCTDRPSVSIEEWPHPVEQPLGREVLSHFERQDFLRDTDDAALLGCRFRLADEVVQEQVGLPGAEDPQHVVFRQQRGMRRATEVDTVPAGFAGASDGSLPAGPILDAIAQLIGEDAAVLRARTPSAIRLLVEQGFLEPVT